MNPELERLAAGYLAGEITDADMARACREHPGLLDTLADHEIMARLLARVLAPDDARRFAREATERIRLSGSGEAFASVLRIRAEAEVRGQRRRRVLRWALPMAAAAMLTVAAGLVYLSQPEALARVVSFAGGTGGEWDPAAQPNADGSTASGWLVLRRGFVELEVINGVRVVLQGPARLRFRSQHLAELTSGQLVARVPKGAEGFSVLTPQSEIVDLGTEFGVAVSNAGATELHVLSGAVKARRSGGKFEHLRQNEARLFSNAQEQVRVIESNPARFLRSLPGASAQNPHYVHWNFDEGSGSVAMGTAVGFPEANYAAALKALNSADGSPPIWAEGQAGRALRFDGKSGYLETDFKGIAGNSPRTVSIWARVPADLDPHNSYALLSWGAFGKPGCVWQISVNPEAKNGQLGALRLGTLGGMVIGSTDLRDDRWHHLAVVMFGGVQADTSTHVLLYVDGELQESSRKSVSISTDLESGKAWSVMMGRNADASQNFRVFRGWMDDVFIFDAALSTEQIRSVMRKGKL